MKNISFGGKTIGKDEPVFIIAEAGINHNGNLEQAKQLVIAAAQAGADAIKFQTHFPEKEMLDVNMSADYVGESFFNLLDRTKISKEDHIVLRDLAKEQGIMFLSTPFSREAADFLVEIDIPAFKTGSGEMTNIPLLTHIAKKNKPMIISTGMSTLEEVGQTIEAVTKINKNIILMQCTSTYPTAYENVNLGAMKLLRDKFNLSVGLSDHSVGVYTALGSVALGAVAIEKHFTIDRTWPGPDQKASIEPQELKELVKGARAIKVALSTEKKIIEGEVGVIKMARESVVTLKDIPKGTKVTDTMVWVKRPGTGIPAKDLSEVIGKVTVSDIKKDSLVSWKDLR